MVIHVRRRLYEAPTVRKNSNMVPPGVPMHKIVMNHDQHQNKEHIANVYALTEISGAHAFTDSDEFVDGHARGFP